MSQRMLFNDTEVIEAEDLTAIGAVAQAATDSLVADAVGYPAHWSGFTATQQSAQIVRLTPGRYYTADTVYAAVDATDINLQIYIPLAASDQRWVALIMRGSAETETALRIFETSTDVDTSEPVQQTAPKREVRKASFTIQQGAASPAPALRPTIADTDAVVAWVLLASEGIALIEPGERSRVKSLYEIEKRVSANEADLGNISRRTTTIETDIVNITQRLRDIPHPTVIRQMKRDIGQLWRYLRLPDEAVAYWFDPGLLPDEWDFAHASWHARVREGVRFPYTQQNDVQMSLIDPGSASIRISGTGAGALLMPAWTEATRIEVESDGGTVNISSTVHTVVSAVRREVARQVIEYGANVTICENGVYWADATHTSINSALGTASAYTSVGQLFTVNGETFETVAITGNAEVAGHVIRAVRQVIQRTVTDVYWDQVTETFGLNGAVMGQTFLNAQPMIATSVDLFFTRVGSSGSVYLVLAECADDGSPRFDRVVTYAEKSVDDLALGWVKFNFRPSLLESGKRYCWFTVTTGNHALGTVSGNRFSQGSRFVCGDGAWSQVLTDSDFAMRINAASFASTRTEIMFNPLTLASGMSEIRLLHGGWIPGGTQLIWQVKPSGGDGEWKDLTIDAARGAASLMGLPALTELRAVMVHTTDLAPAIVLDTTARMYAFRHGNTMVAVSKAQDFGLSTTAIQVEATVDNFEAASHTIAVKCQVGATTYTPTTTETTIDVANPLKRRVLASFTVPSTTSARARIEMGAADVTNVPFIETSSMYAL